MVGTISKNALSALRVKAERAFLFITQSIIGFTNQKPLSQRPHNQVFPK